MDGDWTGTPIFEAARLESKARPGSILVNDVIRVLIGTRGGLEFHPGGRARAEGLPGAPPGMRGRFEEPDPGLPEVRLPSALEVGLDWPLIGRADDADRLLSAWTSVVDKGRDRGGHRRDRRSRHREDPSPSRSSPRGCREGPIRRGHRGLRPLRRVGGDAPLTPLAEGLRWWWRRCLRCSSARWSATRHGRCPARAISTGAACPSLVGIGGFRRLDDGGQQSVKVVAAIADATGPCLVVLDAAHAADRTTLATAGAARCPRRPGAHGDLSPRPGQRRRCRPPGPRRTGPARGRRAPRARHRASRGGRAAAGRRGPGSGRDPRQPPPGYRSGRAAGVERGTGTGRGHGAGRGGASRPVRSVALQGSARLPG